MRRGERASGRRPTPDDLNSRQLAIYQALPTSLQIDFLEMLPPIRPSASDQRKAEQIRARARLFSKAAADLRDHAEALNQLAARAEQGAKVDLRKALDPPALTSLVIRVTRKPQAAAAPEPGETHAPAAEEPKPARGGRRRAATGEASPDGAAPYGRDPAGNAYMPWGAKGDGSPARPRGKYGDREVEQFLAIVREDPKLGDAEATAEYQRRKRRS